MDNFLRSLGFLIFMVFVFLMLLVGYLVFAIPATICYKIENHRRG